MKKIALLLSFVFLLNMQPAHAEDVLPKSFFSYLGSKYLADPGVILIDQSNQKVVYQKGETELRAPASVLKLISTSAIALNMETSTVFKTAIYSTAKPGEFLIVGDDDPWITSSSKEAARLKRAYLPSLLKAALSHKNNLKTISLLYTGVSGSDIKTARRVLRKTSSIRYKALGSSVDTSTVAVDKIAEIKSPTLASIINFTLLYSDNLLAQRLAMLATVRFGYPGNKEGLNQMVNEKLTALNIDINGLHLEDGSGISGGNRVSAVTISQLLLKVRAEPKLKIIYDSLPVGGVSGTLIGRYRGTAPQAVGLVRAKTGSTRHTVSLAGFATSGEKEYVFVVIANHVGSTKRKQNAARAAIDRMLGTITKPPVAPTPVA
jgi:D-alanyl-D-alanine carboxypeptidase/D-alanyl-D-alanine-endopeptidase (penicillin-binding protein 4)